MILVCGEALMDFFPAEFEPERSGFRSFHSRVGGSPFNVAFGLARLGVPCAFLSCLSTDLFGSILRQFLVGEGVDLSLIHTVERPTTLAFVQTEPDGSPQYAFMGENAADRMLSIETLPVHLSEEIRALAFGSFSLAVEPCGTAYEALLLREASKRIIAIDPNVRPRLVVDMEAYRLRLERMIQLSDIVKVSKEDLRELYGENANFTDSASRWQQQGVTLVVITDGAQGAHALLDGEWVFFPAKSTVVVDTVGAGDSFHSALLAGLYQAGYLTRESLPSLRHEAIAPIISRAIIAASVTCARQGANLPLLSDLNR